MANIVRWNPYDEFTRMRDEFTRMFAPFWGGNEGQAIARTWGPSIDIKETDTHIEVSAEIPGVNPGDVDISITDDSITIRGEVKHEAATSEQGYHRVERRFGTFQRTIPLPVAVKHEQATADYSNGILTVKMPKAESGRTKSTHLKINNQHNQLQ